MRAIIKSDWDELSELMNENYDIAREVEWAFDIDDRLRRIGLRNGTIAEKLSGAGNSGVMIFLCPENEERVLKALKKAGAKAFIPRVSLGVQ